MKMTMPNGMSFEYNDVNELQTIIAMMAAATKQSTTATITDTKLSLEEAVNANWLTKTIRSAANVADKNVAPAIGKAAVLAQPTVERSLGAVVGFTASVTTKSGNLFDGWSKGLIAKADAHTPVMPAKA
jgi:hypothetical protein